jgi:diadenosine tetraphosphate (Ap4A) HIT family hydrolase
VAETPEQLHARAAGNLRTPPLESWDTWPFEGALPPRPLAPPADGEPARGGEGGVECWACAAADDDYAWTNERWRLRPIDPPSGLPVVLLLEPREHFDAPGELPDDLAAELGILIAQIERAVSSLEGVGRVHVGRWGEGTEHMHWWFMARPARMTQMASSFAAVWDDILPPTPDEIWNDNVAAVVAGLSPLR